VDMVELYGFGTIFDLISQGSWVDRINNLCYNTST
jgi:hypothetical protein